MAVALYLTEAVALYLTEAGFNSRKIPFYRTIYVNIF